MNAQEQNVITAPGITAEIGEGHGHMTPPYQVITASGAVAFDSIKHLLSNKPIRRPNRSRPMEIGKVKKKRRR
jgi:hypothetical protein